MDTIFGVVVVFLILLLIFLTYKNKKEDIPVIEPETPMLKLPKTSYDIEFAEDQVDDFLSGNFANNSIAGGEAPQLTENAVDSPEYVRQMKTLISYMRKIGYKDKIINDYINHIKDKHLSPQLILVQLRNDANAPPVNIS
jgi:hypothetical protein